MAFVLSQTWDAAEWRAYRSANSAGVAAPAPPYTIGSSRYLNVSGAALLSTIVQLLLFWALLSRLTGAGADDRIAAEKALLRFDLAVSTSAENAPPNPAQAGQEQGEAERPQSQTAASVAVGPPLEWSMTRLPPAAIAAPVEAAEPALAGGGTAPGAGASVYDPYAGASPLYRNAGAAAGGSSPAAGSSLNLDRAALEAIVRTVARALPGSRGTVQLAVRVSPTGIVLDAKPSGGSAPPRARDALARALVGKRLYLGSAAAPATFSLPVLALG